MREGKIKSWTGALICPLPAKTLNLEPSTTSWCHSIISPSFAFSGSGPPATQGKERVMLGVWWWWGVASVTATTKELQQITWKQRFKPIAVRVWGPKSQEKSDVPEPKSTMTSLTSPTAYSTPAMTCPSNYSYSISYDYNDMSLLLLL